jgi:hypothetical protein
MFPGTAYIVKVAVLVEDVQPFGLLLIGRRSKRGLGKEPMMNGRWHVVQLVEVRKVVGGMMDGRWHIVWLMKVIRV